MVAHDLDSLRKADWIIVLERGKILEQGRPEALVRRDHTFAERYLQSA
jgi:ABC-type multidrug transport system fused ATPase/permease subunit